VALPQAPTTTAIKKDRQIANILLDEFIMVAPLMYHG
jgi:hypothetical protein